MFILVLMTVVYILYKMNTEQNGFKVKIYTAPKQTNNLTHTLLL